MIMRTDENNSIWDVYKPILNESIKQGDILGSKDIKVVKGGPSEKGGYKKTLNDTYEDMYDEDEEECDCEGECKCKEDKPVKESKKISKQPLNNDMQKKSAFDRLYNKVLKENFGQDSYDESDELDALGIDDEATDESEFGEGEEDTVTLTLDKETARKLYDLLGPLIDVGDELEGEGEVDESGLDFNEDEEKDEDEDESYDEDEERAGTVVAPDSKGKLANKASAKVPGKPQPVKNSAIYTTTDKRGNDGDHGHALVNAKVPDTGKDNKVSTLKQASEYFK